jgi:hypothetical protein
MRRAILDEGGGCEGDDFSAKPILDFIDDLLCPKKNTMFSSLVHVRNNNLGEPFNGSMEL